MLQASWRRDRRVRLRRTAWRWFLWGLRRYGLPVLAGALVAVGMAAYLLDRFASPHRVAVSALPAPPPRLPDRVATAPEAAVPGESRPADTAPTPALPDIMPSLRLDAQLGRPAGAAASTTPAGPAIPDPDLKPDNWLHSKEP